MKKKILFIRITVTLPQSSQDVSVLMKTKHLIIIMVFGVINSDSDVMHPFIFSYGLRLNTEAYTKCQEAEVLTWIKRVAAGRSDNRTQYHVTQAGEPSVGCQKISATISLQKSGHLTPQIAILLIIVCGPETGEKPMRLRATPKIN